MKEAGPDSWAVEEFGCSGIADHRWRRRVVTVAARAARRPGGRVTEVFVDDAERQGAYGLLESVTVRASDVGAGIFAACARRAASEEFVFCAIDDGGDGGSGGERSARVLSRGEQTARHHELAVDVGGSEQTEVADLDEAARQDVEQEAADEFGWCQGDSGAVLGGEGDAAFVEAAQALVGDADAVGVAAEVLEDLLGATEGWLAVDDPVLLVERVLPPAEGGGISEVGARAVEFELAAVGAMDIFNSAGTFTCTETAYDVAGNALPGSRSFSTTATGITQQLFFSGTYLPTTGNFGTMTITCQVPANGQIRSYQVQERA